MIDIKKIGKRLTDLRGNRTREEVAYKVGISAGALALYEAGARLPKDEIKIRLADFYGRTVGEIFFTDDVTHRDGR